MHDQASGKNHTRLHRIPIKHTSLIEFRSEKKIGSRRLEETDPRNYDFPRIIYSIVILQPSMLRHKHKSEGCEIKNVYPINHVKRYAMIRLCISTFGHRSRLCRLASRPSAPSGPANVLPEWVLLTLPRPVVRIVLCLD